MTRFNQRPGTKSAVHHLKTPFPDLAGFDAVVRALILANPLGCMSHFRGGRNHPPAEKVREMYTAKFVYEDPDGRRVGAGQETYHSVEGYQYGIAAILANMANFAAHGGKARHIQDSDLYSVILKCHDPEGEDYFLAIARNRVTVASYEDDVIKDRVEEWIDSVPALA